MIVSRCKVAEKFVCNRDWSGSWTVYHNPCEQGCLYSDIKTRKFRDKIVNNMIYYQEILIDGSFVDIDDYYKEVETYQNTSLYYKHKLKICACFKHWKIENFL